MQIQITGRKVEVTDAMKSFVEDKFGKLSRHFDHIGQVHVILDIDRGRHVAEAKMHIPGPNGDLFAETEADNMYAAIDLLLDKLDRQILKHKEKMKSHH
jgi:putative sigma-54 modulation protein